MFYNYYICRSTSYSLHFVNNYTFKNNEKPPPKYVPVGSIIRHLDWYDPGFEGVTKSVLSVMVHPGSRVVVGIDVKTEIKSPPLY